MGFNMKFLSFARWQPIVLGMAAVVGMAISPGASAQTPSYRTILTTSHTVPLDFTYTMRGTSTGSFDLPGFDNCVLPANLHEIDFHLC